MGRSAGFVPPREVSRRHFWGVVIKPGETLKCDPGKLHYHISHILLNTGKVNEDVKVFVEVAGNKFLLGTLSVDKHPKISTDLIFKKEFTLLHSSRTSSISFIGYKVMFTFKSPTAKADGESDEEVPLAIPLDFYTHDDKSNTATHGANELTVQKPAAAAPSTNPKAEKAKNPGISKTDDDDSDQSDDDSEDGESDDDEDMTNVQDPSDEDDSESSDEDEDSPLQNTKGNKRPLETSLRTPPVKKAKIVTSSTGNKTGYVHVATPYPSKQANKAPANSESSTGKRSGHVHVATPHPAAKQARKTPANNEKSFTGNKTGYVHVATPYPSKQAKKAPANSESSTGKRSGHVHVATPHPAAKQTRKMPANNDKSAIHW